MRRRRLSLVTKTRYPSWLLPTHGADEHSQHEDPPGLAHRRILRRSRSFFIHRPKRLGATPISLSYMSNRALRFDDQVYRFTSILRRVLLALLTHNEHPLLRTHDPHSSGVHQTRVTSELLDLAARIKEKLEGANSSVQPAARGRRQRFGQRGPRVRYLLQRSAFPWGRPPG